MENDYEVTANGNNTVTSTASDPDYLELLKRSRRLKALYIFLLNPEVQNGFDTNRNPKTELEFDAELDRFADFLKI